VGARLRSAYRVGSTLSGGLDSSSVTCTARSSLLASRRSRTLQTFSLVFPSLPAEDLRVIDERPYINSVLDLGELDSHLIRADELSPMQDTERIHCHLDEPNGAPNLYLHWAIYQSAKQHQVRVMLDGFDGDSAVSHGYDRLSDLARGLRWWPLWRELDMLARHQNAGVQRRHLASELCLKPLIPTWAAFGNAGVANLIDPAFARGVSAEARVRRLTREPGRWSSNTRTRHAHSLRGGIYAHTLSVAERASAAFGVEARYPFFDRRVIEFCIGLPAEQKLGQGWSRLVLRRGMRGVLPEQVRWRHGKGNLSPNFRRGLLGADRARLDQVIEGGTPPLGPYVDPAAASAAYRRLRENPLDSAHDSVSIFSAVNLALWLDSTGLRP
jgi:asparagine synthase (glutamine-hydrolysing)